MCLRQTRYYTKAGEKEVRGGGVWERIRGRAEASVIYTYLSTDDTPPTVIHAVVDKKKNLSQLLRPSLRGLFCLETH